MLLPQEIALPLPEDSPSPDDSVVLSPSPEFSPSLPVVVFVLVWLVIVEKLPKSTRSILDILRRGLGTWHSFKHLLNY